MPTYFVPIEGLTILESWKVGTIVFQPAAVVLDEARQLWASLHGIEWFDDWAAEQDCKTFAEVEANDLDSAIDLAAQAVDVLRVFQHVRHGAWTLPHFGVVGDVGRGIMRSVAIDGENVGLQTSHRGNFLGWTFDRHHEWLGDAIFQWAAGAIGSSSVTESQSRALIGIQLLSQALVEQRGTLKMVQLVGALEAWLLPRKGSGQTFRLARAVAFFGCGRHNNDLCGRSRPTCVYLDLDPDKKPDREKLKKLQVVGKNPPWRCSEWHRVVDWYDERSDVVHGSGPAISYKSASNALYWVYANLAEPILQWLADHPTDPVGALEAGIAMLPAAPDWEAQLGAMKVT